jgi:protein-tyrosine-phosphatase
MRQSPYHVLFLCTGNSARSILAETILNHKGKGRFRAFSAGSHPNGRVHPAAIALLRKLGHPLASLRSKSWEEFSGPKAPRIDFVFTVCGSAAAEVCPVWPGQPLSAHWGLPDPAAVEGTEDEIHFAFADTYRMLEHRISRLVNLPLESLDRLGLQKQFDEIGNADTNTENP